MPTKRTRIPRVNIERLSDDAWMQLNRLFETPMDSPVYEANPYALNKALGWRPWDPYACEVWRSEKVTEIWYTPQARWTALREQLLELQTEYLKRRGDLHRVMQERNTRLETK